MERNKDPTFEKSDDYTSTEERPSNTGRTSIQNIPIHLIDDFPNHPFKVKEDEDMMQLINSIRTLGVITPAIVRRKEDNRYELIAGHRRKKACKILGINSLRCEIVDLSKDEAIVLMVDSNCQRSQILPSEKAFAYQMMLSFLTLKIRVQCRLSRSIQTLYLCLFSRRVHRNFDVA